MKLSPRKWLLLLPVAAAGASVAVLAILNQGIEAQTSPENSDARLRTRRYQADISAVRGSTLEIIPQLRKYGAHWRTVSVLNEGLVPIKLGASHFINDGLVGSERKVIAEVPVLVFIDELIVTLHAEKDFTRVDVHSKSRFPGGSDLGENRRHILQLLGALDEKFEQAKK